MKNRNYLNIKDILMEIIEEINCLSSEEVNNGYKLVDLEEVESIIEAKIKEWENRLPEKEELLDILTHTSPRLMYSSNTEASELTDAIYDRLYKKEKII